MGVCNSVLGLPDAVVQELENHIDRMADEPSSVYVVDWVSVIVQLSERSRISFLFWEKAAVTDQLRLFFRTRLLVSNNSIPLFRTFPIFEIMEL
jgi:hypothetical protein